MLPKIIGRAEEQAILELIYQSAKPELIALYGRRRVGKTHLVRTQFENKKGAIFFYVTGMKDGTKLEQITNFTEEIGEKFLYPGARLEIRNNWRDAFKTLTDNIKAAPKNKKIVMFFDEFPWMVTRRSRLLQILEYFWNQHWSRDSRIKLIICGSSSGWILKHIVNNQGGLYNRTTREIHLLPFNLHKTKQFLKQNKIKLNNKQIARLYMVLGGIPHYLFQVDPGLTAQQAIEKLAFRKDSFLLKEFNNLYATLFGTDGAHTKLAQIISKHPYGIGQEDLVNQIKQLSSGGRVVTWLEELEQAGFIARFVPFQHSKRGIYFRVIDEYSLFYFHWIEAIKTSLLARGMRKGYWESMQRTPAWHAWEGYAFEVLCYNHIPQISKGLGLSPTAIPYTWRYVPRKGMKEQGAQIDLLFDRDDDAITLCEIKYTNTPFKIDKQYAEKIQQKIRVFKQKTRTEKQLFFAMISANGLKSTMYSEQLIDKVIILDDLFKADD